MFWGALRASLGGMIPLASYSITPPIFKNHAVRRNKIGPTDVALGKEHRLRRCPALSALPPIATGHEGPSVPSADIQIQGGYKPLAASPTCWAIKGPRDLR